MAQHALTDPWTLGGLTVPNRVALAPLAGIGNWCVRLQARRHGAGLVTSEMVSSHAVYHGNEKTVTQMLRVHEDERSGAGGTVLSYQLFGQDPDVMREAAAQVAERTRADVIDLNMGCPVPKVMKTGAGAALLDDPDVAVAVASAAREGSGLPVTVKLRSGRRPGDTHGVHLAKRLVAEAGVSAIGFHPRSAAVHHKGVPDYPLAARLVAELDAPVVLTGGLQTAAEVRAAFERTGAAAVMLARGSLGNPWLFAQLLEGHDEEPAREVVLDEWAWLVGAAREHLGDERAGRWLRKAHPWFVDRLGGPRELQARMQQIDAPADVLVVLDELRDPAAVAA